MLRAMSLLLLPLFLLATTAETQTEEMSEETSGYTVSFGGQYRIIADGANFDFHPRVVLGEQPTQSFINRRLRRD